MEKETKKRPPGTVIGIVSSAITLFIFVTGYTSLPEIPFIQQSSKFAGDVLSIMAKTFRKPTSPARDTGKKTPNTTTPGTSRRTDLAEKDHAEGCANYLLSIGFAQSQIDLLLQRGYLTYGEHVATGGKKLDVFEYCCWPSAGSLTLHELKEYMREHGMGTDYDTYLRQRGFSPWNIEDLRKYGKIQIASVPPKHRELFKETAGCYADNCRLTIDHIKTFARNNGDRVLLCQ